MKVTPREVKEIWQIFLHLGHGKPLDQSRGYPWRTFWKSWLIHSPHGAQTSIPALLPFSSRQRGRPWGTGADPADKSKAEPGPAGHPHALCPDRLAEEGQIGAVG